MRLTTAQFLNLYEQSDEGELSAIWMPLSQWADSIVPPLTQEQASPESRRELFLSAVEVLLRLGYLRLYYQWQPGEPEVPGTPEEQTSVLRRAFPSHEADLFEDGVLLWFYLKACPVAALWAWPGRSPAPLFPGHNPRFAYTNDKWDGRISPEWEHWKFTDGPKRLDDFGSLEEAKAYWDSHPRETLEVPAVERIEH